MENLKILRETDKTRIRKMPYKTRFLYTTEMWFDGNSEFNQSPGWVNTGNSKTLKAAKEICDEYELTH